MGIFKWHEKYINSICKNLGISSYGVLWISFIKGIIIGMIIMCFITQIENKKIDLNKNTKELIIKVLVFITSLKT